MDHRNAAYNAYGTIDCEINHPDYGWIPFTASPNDPDQLGKDIFASMDPADVAPYIPPPPQPLPVPETVSDRQFFQALAMPPYELITREEALAAVKTGEIPAAMVTLINALPDESRFGAEMLLSGATEFKRAHPLTAALGLAFGWDNAKIDQFWRDAAKL
jgi:hypothetical protein